MIAEEPSERAEKGKGARQKGSRRKNPAGACELGNGSPPGAPLPRPRPRRAPPRPTEAGAALAAADGGQHHRLRAAAGTAQGQDPHGALGVQVVAAAFALALQVRLLRGGVAELGRGQTLLLKTRVFPPAAFPSRRAGEIPALLAQPGSQVGEVQGWAFWVRGEQVRGRAPSVLWDVLMTPCQECLGGGCVSPVWLGCDFRAQFSS